MTDPAGNVTTYAYYANTGRLYSVTRTVNSQSIVQYFAYDDQGRQTHVWGNGTHPVRYTYDTYGRRTTMKTYRGGEGWGNENLSQVPFDTAEPEVTTWTYDDATGLLESKADDASEAVTYAYTPDGKLETRTWARGGTTTYSYDPDTGEMTGVDYPGTDTPNVTFSYTRLGRQDEITDGVGTRTFNYSEGASGKLNLVSEAINPSGGGLYSKTLTRDYQGNTATGELAGRDGGFHIGTEYDVNYLYDNAGTGGQLTGTGRFKSVSGPGVENIAVYYSRLYNSELINYVGYNVNSVNAMTGTTYEANRDLRVTLTNWTFTLADTLISQYGYTNDALGRRTNVIRTGRAVDDTAPYNNAGFTEDFGYNKRSELETTDRFLWTLSGGKGNRLTTYGEYDYVYDHIGNRQTYGMDANPDTAYTANDLNQYTGTTYPTEAFTHDFDGNLTQDGTFNYTWDAENRLIEAMTRIEAGQNQSAYESGDKHVYFAYDYMGRRVRKRVETYNGSSWPETSDELFVYDGWNVVLVLNANSSNAITRRCTWGLDLSGTIHGAGGIGGLLAVDDIAAEGSPSYWFFYDGNGNVTQVLDATDLDDVVLTAHYEYDPYGNAIVIDDVDQSGYASANPFRFSTKWFDAETGLGNWGYRYYSPRLGRWLSRDPIGERGGLNLMSFVRNKPTSQIDVLGRQEPGPGEPYDVVALLCYEIGLGMYHCDIHCQSGGGQWDIPFFEFVGGGTGPTTGPAPGGNGHPGWVVKNGYRGEVAAVAFVCPGTCDCILDKGNKINAIQDKVYDLPPELDGNISNSNAVGSTVLGCCGVNLSPAKNAPGWGHSVEYGCACNARTGKTINCRVGCSLLE